MTNLKMINKRNATKLCLSLMIGSSLMLSACNDNNSGGDIAIGHHESPTFTNEEFKNYLKSTEWTLYGANSGQTTISELYDLKEQITVNFDEVNDQNSFGFSVGCNINSGEFSFSGDNIFTVSNVISTEMFCQDLDSAEHTLANFFTQNVKLSVSNATGMTVLVMESDDGTRLSWARKSATKPSAENQALLTQLKNYRWQLAESTNVEIQRNLDLAASVNSWSLNFGNSKEHTTLINKIETNNVTYTTLCNNFSGEAVLVDDAKLDIVEVFNTTNDSCSTILTDAEASLNKLLSTWSDSNLSIEALDKPMLTQTFSDDKKTVIKWQGTKKKYTAKVDGKMFKRTPQGTEVLKEETQTFNNVTFDDVRFCDDSNLYQYGFLHQIFSNVFETTCEYDGQSKIIYTADAPDKNEKFSYKIALTETDY